MIVTITLDANNESELVNQLDQISASITCGSIEDNELMDGSYQIGQSNIELELV